MSDIPRLAPDNRDYLVAALKGAVGGLPFAGNLLAEVVGAVIPQQRLDRVVHFVKLLSERLSDVQDDLLDQVRTHEDLAGVIEEGLRQAAWSTSENRRVHLAALVGRSITSTEIQYSESRYLLRILGELSDVEILWLQWLHTKDLDLHNRNIGLFDSAPPGSKKRALQDSYKQHLLQLNLLEIWEAESRDARPRAIIASPPPLHTAYRATELGRLLLSQILGGHP